MGRAPAQTTLGLLRGDYFLVLGFDSGGVGRGIEIGLLACFVEGFFCCGAEVFSGEGH